MQRTLLVLRLEGYDLGEIESITGIHRAVLGARLHRARNSLARYLEQHAAALDVVECTGEWLFPVLTDQSAATTPTSSSTAAAPSATTPS